MSVEDDLVIESSQLLTATTQISKSELDISSRKAVAMLYFYTAKLGLVASPQKIILSEL